MIYDGDNTYSYVILQINIIKIVTLDAYSYNTYIGTGVLNR